MAIKAAFISNTGPDKAIQVALCVSHGGALQGAKATEVESDLSHSSFWPHQFVKL